MSNASITQPLPSTLRALSRVWLIAAAVYLLAWTLLPPLLSHSFPLDVVESLTWGRESQWGYYKHPPLSPEVLHLFYLAFGKFGPFLLSQLCVVTTLWLVWLTGCRLMDRDRALLGTVLTMGVAYYTWPTLEFNHNIAKMPLWAAIGYCYIAAWQDKQLVRWLLLGLVAGLGLLTKYSMGLLLLCLGLFTLLTPARAMLRSAGPWLAVLVLLACVAPHVYWLWQSDWLPFDYTRERATAESGNPRLNALVFLATQAINHLPLLLITGIALWRTQKEHPLAAAQHTRKLHTTQPAYLLTLALAPGVLLTLLGIAKGLNLRDMWGASMWPFSGLLVAACLPAAWLTPMQPRIFKGVAIWLVLVSLLAGVNLSMGSQLRKRPARVDWPAVSLAEHAQTTWSQLSRCQLDVVAGDAWLAGLITTAQRNGPSVLINGNPDYSPWATPERLQTHGALWVWQEGAAPPSGLPPAALQTAANHPDLQSHQGQWHIQWERNRNGAPLNVQWRAYVPKRCSGVSVAHQ